MENKTVRLISKGKRLLVGPCVGKRTIARATDVFSHIDPDFKNWGTDVAGKATPKTAVVVGELAEDANFAKMFTSLSSDVSKLILTQDQILDFIEKRRDWLRKDGWATFFLFRENNEFFVVFVHAGGGGALGVYVYRLGHVRVWYAGGQHRLVVPQL